MSPLNRRRSSAGSRVLVAIADILPVLIPAALTSVAAIAATAVGYRQWRKQSALERSKGRR